MSLSPFVFFQSRFVTYLLTFPRTFHHVTELSRFIAQKICTFQDTPWHRPCWGTWCAWYCVIQNIHRWRLAYDSLNHGTANLVVHMLCVGGT